MKFRTIGNTDILISEVGLACGDQTAPPDKTDVERLFRLAQDEGINFFFLSGVTEHFESAFRAAFDPGVRARVKLALCLPWMGGTEMFMSTFEKRLRSFAISAVDVLFLQDVNKTDLQNGAVADAVHRIRASGGAKMAGLVLGRVDSPDDSRLIERNGFGLVEGDFEEGALVSDDKRFPMVVRPPRLDGVAELSFLWDETGRTAAQAEVQVALSHANVASVLIEVSDAATLKERARAPLAPPLTSEQVHAARSALNGSPAAAAVRS